FHFRHQVDGLIFTGDQVTGVHGTILAADTAKRGASSNRKVAGSFEFHAQAVGIATGGIGGNHDQVRRWWPKHLGTAPKKMITGAPAHVDGRMLDIAYDQGVRLVNRDRMWHYTEGHQKEPSPLFPHTWTRECSASQMNRVFVSLTGIGCGTTLKDCSTGHRFSQTMQFVFFQDPPRFGCTLLAGNYLLQDCPATTHRV